MNEYDAATNATILMICVVRSIRKEMFKNYVLTSDVISASELYNNLDMAILTAIQGTIAMQTREEINAEWRQTMEFIKTVTARV